MSENKLNNDISGVFKIMEKRYIFTLCIQQCYYLGSLEYQLFTLSQGIELLKAKWFLIKIIAVIILTGYHFYNGHCLRSFNQDLNNSSPKFFRVINEIPTILLILIVFLAILKPM